MTKRRSLTVLMVALLFALVLPKGVAEPVLIYKGIGSCEEGCSEALDKVARNSGHAARLVTPDQLSAKILMSASVWVQPGGSAIDVARTLTVQQKYLLREFVHHGGVYMGFCAGAFLTDDKVDDAGTITGLGLLPGTTYDYVVGKPGAAAILPVQWEGHKRHLFFEDGPGFRLNPLPATQIIATYPDGSPAVFSFRFGKGRVILSGVHPEAPASWAQESNLVDEDGEDLDLALELFRRAFGN